MHNIIIIGAGGFGREVYQWSLAAFDKGQYKIKGFLSKNKEDLEGFDIPAGIIGDEDSYKIQENDRFILGIGSIAIRKKVVSALQNKGAEFIRLVHPTAIVSRNSVIGEGVVICPYSIVTDSVVIGDFSMLNIYSSCGHDAKLGMHCVLSPYATLNGGAVLGDGVFMATHTVVTGSKTVGDGCVIGANSIVLHNIPDNSKVIGVSRLG
jgi:sugar O-acyltransferase (sialic acid O-acetyltransferase NeuD family)